MAKLFRFTVLLLLAFPLTARADYINLTGAENARSIAEISVEDDQVRVVLEIFVQDIGTFIELLPDEFFRESEVTPPPLAVRMDGFSKETFQVVTGEGEHLQAELKLSEPRIRKERFSPFAGMINPYTRKPIPGPPEDKRVLYAEFVYPFRKRPDSLTIIPPLDESGRPAASIGFVTFHKGVTVTDFRFLSEKATLRLDWEDPWYSSFEEKAYKRWQQEGVRAYLYIEPYEVRYEVLARVQDLAAWMDLDLRGGEYIEEDEFEPLKERIGAFFLNQENVLIDGKRYQPILDRTSFVKYTLTRTIFLEQPERMPLQTAMVGVIITFVTEGIPQEVTVDWNLFSDRIQKVPTVAEDPAGPFPSYVTPDDRTFTWTNYLKTYRIPTVTELTVDDVYRKINLPAGSLLCLLLLVPVGWNISKGRKEGKPLGVHYGLAVLLAVGAIGLFPLARVPVARPAALAPQVPKEQAVEILQSLLESVYRSFDFREEEAVYDRLAVSVTGDLLEEIYLQNRRSFEVKQAGGAKAKVKEVEILDVEVEDGEGSPLALLFRTEWTATGTVGHWGHIHMRRNRYKAKITVEPVDGSWKITDLELLEEERIDPYAPRTEAGSEKTQQ
jgi:hypothetical protein